MAWRIFKSRLERLKEKQRGLNGDLARVREILTQTDEQITQFNGKPKDPKIINLHYQVEQYRALEQKYQKEFDHITNMIERLEKQAA